MVKPVWNNGQRVNHQNFAKKTHPCAKKNLVPRAVLMKSGLVSINIARQNISKIAVLVNTARQVNAAHSKIIVNAARPMPYLSKIAHSTVKGPIHKNTTFKNNNINQRVNTVRGKKFNTAKPKVVVNAVKGNSFNAVKASAYYEEIDGGYVVFGGNPKGGKIIGKCTIKTGKFDVKADEGFFVGYSLNSKAFRVFNSRTRIVEENLHIRFSESTPNAVGSEPDWLFYIDALTRTTNYEQIIAGTQSNGFTGTKASDNVGQARKKTEPVKYYILLPLSTADPPYYQDLKSSHDDGSKPSCDDGKKVDENIRKESECNDQEKEDNVNSTNNVNAAGTDEVNAIGGKTSIELAFDPNMPALEDYSIFEFLRNDEDDSATADMNNLDITIQVNPIPTTRFHKDHPLNQVIGDLQSATQTRKMSKNLEEHGFIKAMQEELLQFKLQKFWTLVDLPNGKRAIGSKWGFRNKRDERGIVIRNKARLVTQGYTQEEGIDYDEVFAPVAKIEAIRLFLAYASFKDFVEYQMDVKSAFLYGKIEEEVYVCQPLGFEDPEFPDRVYKVEKVLYGLHQAPKAWYETLSTYLLDNWFQRGKTDKSLFIKRHKSDILLISSMGELTFILGLQVKLKKDGIFISQDKYVEEILKKFGFTKVKTASTPMETQKPLLKDENGKEVDVHMYRSMIGSFMYLTSSRPDIMFAVCACARYQVNPKVSHLHAMKRIVSDYARASLDRKSTTGGCQFFGCRLISWQCKKHTVVANSTTEAEYVAASSCRKVNKSVKLMMKKLFRMELELMLVPQPSDPTKSVTDAAVHKESGDSLVRAATTVCSLKAEQDSGNINKTQSKATPNESSSLGTTSGGGPREMITSQLQGKLRLYDEVRARTLFVLSSSNRGRLLGIIDLMRQKNKRMKQEGLNRQIRKLQDVN
ncbi:putative ribonuclease H-like domain-containing protein [Tanacetum coccineum]|uniref:Ribonuclease H-like domain-containing protein n=1 Tax=Tanacetum coccineum TaxID=301880 RepID=A0ABQ5APP1_9ASTR